MFTAIKLKLKTKCPTKSPRVKLDLTKDPEIAEVFQAKVDGKLVALCVLDSDVDSLANSLKVVLLSTAEEVLGRHRKKKTWVTHEVVNVCEQRQQLKRHKYTCTEVQNSEQRSQDEDEGSKRSQD